MAILSDPNFLGQMRLDVPFARLITSGVRGDFDALVGRAMAGSGAYVLRGFAVNGSVGSAANSLSITVADGILINLNATESGSILWVSDSATPETLNNVTNPKVIGAFTSATTNYVGMDFTRTANSSTADVIKLLDPNTDLEDTRTVPLLKTLSYKIVISTTNFASQPNLVPIAQIVTDASNNVASNGIIDARPMYLGIGGGGDTPNITASYAWPYGRTPDSLYTFTGGDKQFASLKELLDAHSTRLWELGGGERWTGASLDHNVTMFGSGTPFSDSDYFEWDGTNLHWKGLIFTFDNSTSVYNTVANQTTNSAGLTDLADGDCIYVDLNRATNAAALTAHKAALTTLGAPTIPGSRWVIAWRNGSNVYTRGSRLAVGTPIPVATTTTDGIVRLFQTPGSSSHPVVLNLDSNSSIAWTASASNATAIAVTGNGNAPGLNATGGDSNGTGIVSHGGHDDTNTTQGTGAEITGGDEGGHDGNGGVGAIITGGQAGDTTGDGGDGAHFVGGDSIGGGGGYGLRATPGALQDTAIRSNGWIDMTAGRAPGSTEGPKDTLTKSNMIKAWALMKLVNGANTTAQNIQNGFNIASATTTNAAAGQITVTFTTPFLASGPPNTNYMVMANPEDATSIAGPKAAFVRPITRTDSTVVFEFIDYTAAGIDISGSNLANMVWSFMAIGFQ